MLEEKKQMIYLSVNQQGEMERFMGQDEPAKHYSRIGGFVQELRSKKRKIKDNEITFLYVYLKDEDENLSLQVPMYMGGGPDILRCLYFAAESGFDFVKEKMVFIETYRKSKEGKSFTNATVYWGLTKLDWAPLPNGISREEGLDEMMKTINEYIVSKGAATEAPGAPAASDFHSNMDEVGDMPDYHASPFDKE